MSNAIVVKQVRPNIPVFDVFTGQGWLNWTRMSWNNKTKRLAIEAGERLNPFELKEVYNQVEVILHHG